MTAADTDDLLIQALEPGERIVWSDRPHRISSSALHMLWRRLTTWSSLLALVFLAFVGFVFVSMKDRAEAGTVRAFSWEGLGVPLVLGLAAVPILIEIFWFLHSVARTSAHRYAVTDRGRGVFVMPDMVGTFELPPPTQITTGARGAAEHGDIELGTRIVTERSSAGVTKQDKRRVIFRAVSYPLVTVDTIRSAAKPL